MHFRRIPYFPSYISLLDTSSTYGALEGSWRPARQSLPFPPKKEAQGGDAPRVTGKFVSEKPGPGRLTPRPVPGPLNSCWTLIVQLITVSTGLWSVCVGTLCKHFLFGSAGNEGMTRSSDFTQLLLPCPSSQAPTRACWRPFPRLLSRVRGMAKQLCGPLLAS